MEVRETHNAAEFLKLAEKFLMEHEAENNLILGQAMRLARGETAGLVSVNFYLVEDEGRVLVAGMHNQPYRLVLTRGPGPAVAMIADWTARKKVNLTGVIGIPDSVTMFTRAWSKLSRDKVKGGHRLRLSTGKSGGLHRATHRARVHGLDRLPGKALTEQPRLAFALVAEWRIDCAGKAVLGGGSRRAMSGEEESSD
jgi:hypothetical protein